MKRSNVNVIIDNAINSQDYYRMYSSRDFYRGTSFKMAGAWTPDTHYFNDEHIIDFISCEGALLYCLRGHLSSEWNKPNLIYKDDIIVGVESNPYWAFIMGNSGKGQKGDKGDIGPIGPSGTDGITPQLKIEDGRWLLSMDKGQTWQDIGQATGDPGPAGKDGVDGLPGIGIEVRYCLGTTTIYGGTSTPGTTRQPTGWNLAVPTPTEETPYIWFIQARVNYTSNADKVGTIEGSWSTPTKLSGTNGLNGENGSKGQIIYPEGIYNVNTVYQGTADKTPYVYDSNDANYFDFRTGAGHMAAGKIKFGSDGSVDLTNIKINNAIVQNIKQYSLTQSSDPHILDSLYSEIIYSPTIHEDVTLKVNASEYQLNIDDSYSGVIHNKSDKQLFIYPFDNGNDDESIKICGYYNGRLLFSYDEPILFNASQILLPAGGVLEFKFVPSSIVNNYYVGTIWVENTSDFELKTWKQNGTLRSDLYYKSYDDYNSDSFLACGEVYFNSSGVPSLSGFSRCRTDLVLTVSQSGNFSANLDLTSIYNGRTLSISTIAFSQPIWDGAMLKMFYGSARGRINGAFLDIRTADGKVPTTSISVPFLILGSK